MAAVQRKPVVILVDGDILAFQVAATSQKSYDFDGDGDKAVYLNEHEDVLRDLKDKIDGYVEGTQADKVIICLSDKENWRKSVMPSYKENRKDAVRPELLSVAKDLLRENYYVLEYPTLEADDVMGIFSTDPDFMSDHTKVIVSIDKDMKTVPGWLYNPNYGVLEQITEQEADLYHMMQTITGDVTDGYPGCPGAGKVAAEKALIDCVSLWEGVLSVYFKKAAKDALLNAQVSNILRHGQYDFKKHKVKLWKPQT